MARARFGLWLLLLLSSWAWAGCAGGPPPATGMPQEAALYQQDAARELAGAQYQNQLMQDFQARFLEPWSAPRPDFAPPMARAMLDAILENPGVGENLRPRSRAWAEQMAMDCDLELFPSQFYPALTVRATDLRLLPTDKPLFRAAQPGSQGYPFDRLQESRLAPNTPVQVQHVSRDGSWALVLSHHGIGWARLSDLAQVKPEQVKQWQTGRYAAVIREGVKVKDTLGRVHFLAGIGTVLPYEDEDYGEIKALAGVSDAEGRLVIKKVRLNKQDAALMPLPLTPGAVAALADAMVGQPYGWGGYLGNRDCSALIKDIFTPFALWLPRNSADQAKFGITSLDLSGLGDSQKEAVIAQQGVPHASLLWMPGHIMLYLGQRQEGVIVLHSIWAAGAATAQGQPLPLGRVVISSLDLSQIEGETGQRGDLRSKVQALVQLLPPDQPQR